MTSLRIRVHLREYKRCMFPLNNRKMCTNTRNSSNKRFLMIRRHAVMFLFPHRVFLHYYNDGNQNIFAG